MSILKPIYTYNDYSETELKDFMRNELSRNFKIKEEWWGSHFSGRKVRIDMLIKPKQTSEWANKDVIFGIEFKRGNLDNTGYINDYIRQCIDYSNTKFDKIGYIPILMCPPIFEEHHMTSRFTENIFSLLKSFNIGQLYHSKNGLSIVYAGWHQVWAEKIGVHEGKRWQMKTKFGSL